MLYLGSVYRFGVRIPIVVCCKDRLEHDDGFLSLLYTKLNCIASKSSVDPTQLNSCINDLGGSLEARPDVILNKRLRVVPGGRL